MKDKFMKLMNRIGWIVSVIGSALVFSNSQSLPFTFMALVITMIGFCFVFWETK